MQFYLDNFVDDFSINISTSAKEKNVLFLFSNALYQLNFF